MCLINSSKSGHTWAHFWVPRTQGGNCTSFFLSVQINIYFVALLFSRDPSSCELSSVSIIDLRSELTCETKFVHAAATARQIHINLKLHIWTVGGGLELIRRRSETFEQALEAPQISSFFFFTLWHVEPQLDTPIIEAGRKCECLCPCTDLQ